ncbi:MAG: DUF4129 domain-containing protein, partial [Methanoregula sp.]|nr:DUF4129 domain-containing protein [Methanoregula sp.]
QQLNSTTDLLPLMQDLMDCTGPIVLNVNLKDSEQARRDLAVFAKYNKNLDNMIIKLDMKESEINDFAKSKTKQKELLDEMLNASVSLDELKNLEIQYRDQDNPNMLVSVSMQQEAIRGKVKEIYGQYQNETKKVVEIGTNFGANATKEGESQQEFKQIVEINDKIAQIIETPHSRIPTLSLLIKPDTGKYQDIINISAFYSSTEVLKNNHPITIFIDNNPVRQGITDNEGVFHDTYVIENITAGIHQINATSGSTASEPIILNITLVPSSTSINIIPVKNKPEFVQVSGTVIANKPVIFAPVNIVVDSRTSIQLTTDKNGLYKTQTRFSPGRHWIDARFDNASYPVFSSISSAYEIVASQDKILSITLINVTRNADTLRLTLIPYTATYKDIVNFSGILSGRDPKYQNVDVFIDDAYYRTLLTGSDGSYAEPYIIEKIKTGKHTVFTSYIDPGVGEIRSELRQFVVNSVDSRTLLEIERTDNGTRLTCRGNVTANGQGISSVPLELVWDDWNVINIRTDVNGSFLQKVVLPVGNHSIYARFTSQEYPVISSRSSTYPITILPPVPGLSLEVKPTSGIYTDSLTFNGVLDHPDNREKAVDIYIDNKFLTSTTIARTGQFSQNMVIEQLPAGQLSVQARLNEMSSGVKTFTVLPVHTRTTLTVTPVNNSALFTCNGTVMAFDQAGDIIRRPVSLKEVHDILATLGKDPMKAAKRPVSAAPVALKVNNETLLEMQTDAVGRFSSVVVLQPGDNVITARFVNQSFPLFTSQSKGISVNIPSANLSLLVETRSSSVSLLAPVIVVAAILLLFIGGSIFYLKRRSIFFRTRQTPADLSSEPEILVSPETLTKEIEEVDPFLSSVSPPDPDKVSPDPIFAQYVRILNERGLSTAARAVYIHFTRTIAEKLHIRRHRTLTPREFLRSCDKRPFTGTFSTFITVYEHVRYGGARTPAKESEFEESVKKTDESIGGEED